MRLDRFGKRCLLSAVVAVVSTVGCSRGDRLETYPTSGKITFTDGKPFAGGSQSFIVFESMEHPVTATGVIDIDGNFKLSTYDPDDGAVAGRHRVLISPPIAEGDPDRARPIPTIDPKYLNLDTSGLEATVEATGENHLTITVEAP